MMASAAERARVTSMIIVIGIIVFITGITAFIAGRLQSKGSSLKQDIQAASRDSVPIQGGDPAQKIIVNTEERERLRIMKQMNDQLLLGVMTGGIITISILIVSMLIVNMGDAQRHHALERVEDLMPLPQMMVPRRAYDVQPAQLPPPQMPPQDRNAVGSPRRRINRNATSNIKRTSNAKTSPTRNIPLTEAEVSERMSNNGSGFDDKKLPSGLTLQNSKGALAKGVGNLDDEQREKLVDSEAGKMMATFYSAEVDKQAERDALQQQLGGVDDLEMSTAKELARKKYGFQSNADMIAKRNAVFRGGMFGRITGDGDDASPTRLY